jgi:hypothetical protein
MYYETYGVIIPKYWKAFSRDERREREKYEGMA